MSAASKKKSICLLKQLESNTATMKALAACPDGKDGVLSMAPKSTTFVSVTKGLGLATNIFNVPTI
jgi:hypothetical protein